MRAFPFVLILAVTILSADSVAQSDLTNSNRGPAFPSSGSQRGSNFPKDVSPTQSNPTNSVVAPRDYTQPDPWRLRLRQNWRKWHR